MSTTLPDRELLADGLRAWARGALNLMAAADFVIETGTAIDQPWVRFEQRGDGTPWAWFEWDRLDVAGMSSGQRATWELTRSLCEGELDDLYWRLDGRRKEALLRALIQHA